MLVVLRFHRLLATAANEPLPPPWPMESPAPRPSQRRVPRRVGAHGLPKHQQRHTPNSSHGLLTLGCSKSKQAYWLGRRQNKLTIKQSNTWQTSHQDLGDVCTWYMQESSLVLTIPQPCVTPGNSSGRWHQWKICIMGKLPTQPMSPMTT